MTPRRRQSSVADLEDDDEPLSAIGDGEDEGHAKGGASSSQSRRAQNRLAQREFRLRKQQYVRDLEARVEVLSGDKEERVELMVLLVRNLLKENKELRGMVKSMASFVGEGLGSCLPRLGLSAPQLDAILNRADTDTAYDAFIALKASKELEEANPGLQFAEVRKRQRHSTGGNANSKRKRGSTSVDNHESHPDPDRADGKTNETRPSAQANGTDGATDSRQDTGSGPSSAGPSSDSHDSSNRELKPTISENVCQMNALDQYAYLFPDLEAFASGTNVPQGGNINTSNNANGMMGQMTASPTSFTTPGYPNAMYAVNAGYPFTGNPANNMGNYMAPSSFPFPPNQAYNDSNGDNSGNGNGNASSSGPLGHGHGPGFGGPAFLPMAAGQGAAVAAQYMSGFGVTLPPTQPMSSFAGNGVRQGPGDDYAARHPPETSFPEQQRNTERVVNPLGRLNLENPAASAGASGGGGGSNRYPNNRVNTDSPRLDHSDPKSASSGGSGPGPGPGSGAAMVSSNNIQVPPRPHSHPPEIVEEMERKRRLREAVVKLSTGKTKRDDEDMTPAEVQERASVQLELQQAMKENHMDERAAEAMQLTMYHLSNYRMNHSYNLPPSLKPTPLQRTVPHEYVIDGIPYPSMRDRMILLRGQYDLVSALTDIVKAFTLHGDDVLSHESWEISEEWIRKYHVLVDDSILSITNKWRAERGAPPIVLPAPNPRGLDISWLAGTSTTPVSAEKEARKGE